MTIQYTELLTQFETLEIDPKTFGHAEHVQVAFEMLHKYSYLDACTKYMKVIDVLAKSVGAHDKLNITITFAFLSLIAERIYEDQELEYEAFIAKNPDLLSRKALAKWYTKEEITSDFARTHFLLPSKAF